MVCNCKSRRPKGRCISQFGVGVALACFMSLAGIIEPLPAHSQVTQGPSGPFMAQDSTGRVVGAADYSNVDQLVMWITIGSTTAPIIAGYDNQNAWEYRFYDLYFTSSDCSGQTYV
jgi:hypothetical protein